MLVDADRRIIRLKVVYYGPAMSGKTTNLEWLSKKEGLELMKIDTHGDRTLVFDFASKKVNMGSFIASFAFYTVPGQEIYKDIRLTVLRGVDALVIVYDAQKERLEENLRFKELIQQDLQKVGKSMASIPIVLQYNKMDLSNAMDYETLKEKLNPENYSSVPAVAIKGEGVLETVSLVTDAILSKLSKMVG